jgi:hypothetical protein
VTFRIDIPKGGAKWPAHVRAFNVAEDGSETEVTEIASIEIVIRTDDVIRARIESFLTETTSIYAEGTVVRLCPECGREVQCPEH